MEKREAISDGALSQGFDVFLFQSWKMVAIAFILVTGSVFVVAMLALAQISPTSGFSYAVSGHDAKVKMGEYTLIIIICVGVAFLTIALGSLAKRHCGRCFSLVPIWSAFLAAAIVIFVGGLFDVITKRPDVLIPFGIASLVAIPISLLWIESQATQSTKELKDIVVICVAFISVAVSIILFAPDVGFGQIAAIFQV